MAPGIVQEEQILFPNVLCHAKCASSSSLMYEIFFDIVAGITLIVLENSSRI